MKLMVFIDTLIDGGIERRMLELVKTLSKDKTYQIHLITLTDRVDYEYVYTLPIKFEIVKRKTKRDLSLYLTLYKKVKEFKPDIIHSWGSMSSIYLAPIALLQKIKFVNGYIGQAPLKISIDYRIRNLLTFFISDAIVSNSKAGLHAYDTPEKKSYCIYNGMDFKRFENLKSPVKLKKEILGNENDKSFIVAMVAAFEERKDYDTFVKVAIEVCDSNDSIKFLLIGGGNNLENIVSKIPKKYLNTRILALGRISDIESILQIIDVGILLTNSKVHGEGVSNSIIEYMASSKPVIATRGGGTDEVVFDGKNGFLVDYAADKQIVEKIQKLFENRTMATEMGKNGYDFVHEKFDIVNVSQLYVDLYHKLLGTVN